MNVCIKCGQLRLALECWENMQREAIEPNVVSAVVQQEGSQTLERVSAANSMLPSCDKLLFSLEQTTRCRIC